MTDTIVISGELYSAKNSRQIRRAGNRTFVSKSDVARRDEKRLAYVLPTYRPYFREMLAGLPKPYRLSFKIFRRTRGRFDYVNIIQGLLDAMVRANLLDDDNANEIIPSFEPYEVDREDPRVEITVIRGEL